MWPVPLPDGEYGMFVADPVAGVTVGKSMVGPEVVSGETGSDDALSLLLPPEMDEVLRGGLTGGVGNALLETPLVTAAGWPCLSGMYSDWAFLKPPPLVPRISPGRKARSPSMGDVIVDSTEEVL